MKVITLRNIPPRLARVIEEEASKSKASLNKTVIRLLEKATGLGEKRPRVYHDLDHLAGSWSEEEAAAFDKELAHQRTIDPELWE